MLDITKFALIYSANLVIDRLLLIRIEDQIGLLCVDIEQFSPRFGR